MAAPAMVIAGLNQVSPNSSMVKMIGDDFQEQQ